MVRVGGVGVGDYQRNRGLVRAGLVYVGLNPGALLGDAQRRKRRSVLWIVLVDGRRGVFHNPVVAHVVSNREGPAAAGIPRLLVEADVIPRVRCQTGEHHGARGCAAQVKMTEQIQQIACDAAPAAQVGANRTIAELAAADRVGDGDRAAARLHIGFRCQAVCGQCSRSSPREGDAVDRLAAAGRVDGVGIGVDGGNSGVAVAGDLEVVDPGDGRWQGQRSGVDNRRAAVGVVACKNQRAGSGLDQAAGCGNGGVGDGTGVRRRGGIADGKSRVAGLCGIPQNQSAPGS